MTQIESRCGCFLPDLTGLARSSSTASLSRGTISDTRARKASLAAAHGYVQARGANTLNGNAFLQLQARAGARKKRGI